MFLTFFYYEVKDCKTLTTLASALPPLAELKTVSKKSFFLHGKWPDIGPHWTDAQTIQCVYEDAGE